MIGDVFVEENGFYQIDFTTALWAIGNLNSLYDAAKLELSDVDFIAEIDDGILLVEYKNSKIPCASRPELFNPANDETIKK